MREEDFKYKYALNVDLIDYLLKENEANSKRLKSIICYISQNFEQTEAFFAAYFISGNHIDAFIRYLSREWPEFGVAAISSKHGIEQISYILKFVDADYISESMNTDNLLTNYLSEQGHLIFTSDLPLPENYNILKILNVRFHDLALLEKNHAVLEFSHDECLYTINSKNVVYILKTFSGSKNIDTIKSEKENYTSILASENENLKKYIEQNLPDYIENVFLNLTDNSDETETTIKKLLNHDMIEDELKEKIISKQKYIFETFDEIPENLYAHLLLDEKVVITWKNISAYFSYEDNDKGVIT
ncbi:MAG: hypothetical protein ACC656_06960, partial [Candidatus Heimdallarchaeota archaeon]